MTDALKCISENTAKYAGGGYMTQRFFEIIHPAETDDRTGNEIISELEAKFWPRKNGGDQQ